MAKISPVSIKYMIHANFLAEGALERPDVVGALFGQTEGLLGSELELRELQKEGKIGRIEVNLEREGKRTTGVIKIPTALDQSETTLIGAAIETIDRIGPSDAQIEVERIEDVRGSKRDYIIERAKKLMKGIEGTKESQELYKQVFSSSRVGDIKEYGEEKLPYGDISGKEVIVVEGRADVVNLLKHGVRNVIAMTGTKLPNAIKELGEEKDLVLFVDGDRGGRLIARNVVDNAKVKKIAQAPDGKEVEELTGKEVIYALRKKVPVKEFFSSSSYSNGRKNKRYDRNKGRNSKSRGRYDREDHLKDKEMKEIEITDEMEEKMKELMKNNDKEAIILDEDLNILKKVSTRGASKAIPATKGARIVIIGGTATVPMIKSSEKAKISILAAKNFATSESDVKLISL